MPLILPNDIANEILADGDKLQQNFATIEDYVNQEVVTRDGNVGMTGALLLPGVPTQPNQAATKKYVDDAVTAGVGAAGPIGTVLMFGGDTAPTGYLICQGQAVSRTIYTALFAVVGIRFGPGDGSNTFNLPDMRARSPIGTNTVENTDPVVKTYWSQGVGEEYGTGVPGLLNHNHGTPDHLHTLNNWTGGQSVDHAHGYAVRNDPVSGSVGSVGRSNAGGTIVQFQTGGTNTDHQHLLTGTTGASDRPLFTTYGLSGNQESGNYQPGLSLHFIIKAL